MSIAVFFHRSRVAFLWVLMKCIVQMAYVFLSVKDCEGIWVMPARFVIAQTSGALFADAVLC